MKAREHARARSYFGGKIVTNDGQSVFDCVVKDISQRGARLAVAGALPLPENFGLSLSDGRNFTCTLRWQRINSIGVAFKQDSGGS